MVVTFTFNMQSMVENKDYIKLYILLKVLLFVITNNFYVIIMICEIEMT